VSARGPRLPSRVSLGHGSGTRRATKPFDLSPRCTRLLRARRRIEWELRRRMCLHTAGRSMSGRFRSNTCSPFGRTSPTRSRRLTSESTTTDALRDRGANGPHSRAPPTDASKGVPEARSSGSTTSRSTSTHTGLCGGARRSALRRPSGGCSRRCPSTRGSCRRIADCSNAYPAIRATSTCYECHQSAPAEHRT